jgi:ribosomal protein L1
MTLGTLDYFSRDLYQKIPEENSELKLKAEKLVENISELKEHYDYSFSDIFRYKEGNVEIGIPLSEINPAETLNKIRGYYNLFQDLIREMREK